MKKLAFTMAEILLSLTIIGVVAAITLPSLMGNINERTWNTQRKALHARMSQAIGMMPQLNGYGKYSTDNDGNVVDNAAETFLTEGLSKVLKINNICDSEHLSDCGLPSEINVQAVSTQPVLSSTNVKTLSFPTQLSELNSYLYSVNYSSLKTNTKAAAFETQNGESIAVYYNPNGQLMGDGDTSGYIQNKMCANFVFDLNGSKGPNVMGKDIGYMTAFYAMDSAVVAPKARWESAGFELAEQIKGKCVAFDPAVRLAGFEELAAIVYNSNLSGFKFEAAFYSGPIREVTMYKGQENEYKGTGSMLVMENGIYTLSEAIDWGYICVDR